MVAQLAAFSAWVVQLASVPKAAVAAARSQLKKRLQMALAADWQAAVGVEVSTVLLEQATSPANTVTAMKALRMGSSHFTNKCEAPYLARPKDWEWTPSSPGGDGADNVPKSGPLGGQVLSSKPRGAPLRSSRLCGQECVPRRSKGRRRPSQVPAEVSRWHGWGDLRGGERHLWQAFE